MKKCVYLAILGTLVALLAMVGGVSPAFASTGQATISQTKSARIGRTKRFHFHQNNTGSEGVNEDHGGKAGNQIVN